MPGPRVCERCGDSASIAGDGKLQCPSCGAKRAVGDGMVVL